MHWNSGFCKKSQCNHIHTNKDCYIHLKGWPMQRHTGTTGTNKDRQGQTGTDRDRQGQAGTSMGRQGQTGTDRDRPGKAWTDRDRQ